MPDAALQGLPQANVRKAGDFPDEEFVLIPNVPVFAEHTTTAKDGRPLQFGMQELQAVANRCNQRISESGDYAAICFGHTPSPGEDKPMPAVCGYAGPFRMGTHGASSRKAILADFHVYKSDLEQFKRHPRRSPEVWLEDRYEDMFLDPIAVLSAETPRLDLGLLYSAQKQGRVVEKYAAVAPAAGNTFIPDAKRDYVASQQSTGETQMSLSTDDVTAIIEAIEKQDWVVQVKQMIAAQGGANASMPDPMGADPMMPDAPPPAAPGLEPPPLAPEPAGEMPMGDAPPMAPEPAPEPPMDAGPPAPPAGPEPPMAPGEDDKPKPYSANEQGPYQDGTESEISSGEKVEHDIGSPRKYEAKDYEDMDDDEFEDYSRQRAARKKKKYEASGSVESDNVEQPGNASVEPDNPGPSGEGSAGNDSGEGTGEYQESNGKEVVKFSRKEEQTTSENYALRKELDSLRGRVDTERGKRVDAERMTALSQHSEFYNLDANEEIEHCRYGKMSDDQFGEHLVRIKTRYERRPHAALNTIPTHTEGGAKAAAMAPDRPGGGTARETYSKDASDAAFQVSQARAMRGEEPDYPGVLAAMKAGTFKQ